MYIQFEFESISSSESPNQTQKIIVKTKMIFSLPIISSHAQKLNRVPINQNTTEQKDPLHFFLFFSFSISLNFLYFLINQTRSRRIQTKTQTCKNRTTLSLVVEKYETVINQSYSQNDNKIVKNADNKD